MNEDAAHGIILGGTAESTRWAAAGRSLYPAFSVRSAERARTEAADPMRMRRLIPMRRFRRDSARFSPAVAHHLGKSIVYSCANVVLVE